MRDDEGQTTSTVLMVRPHRFGFNAETAATNAFQQPPAEGPDAIAEAARREHDTLVLRLRAAGIAVAVLDDTPLPHTPDALFPNNWISFHGDGTAVLYPMATASRQAECRPDDVQALLEHRGFSLRRWLDLRKWKARGWALEGTGSLILDRLGRRAWAARSPRTHPDAVKAWAEAMGYEALTFDARDAAGAAIYHTNVMMSVGTDFAVICLEAIPAPQRGFVEESLRAAGRRVIPLGLPQIAAFTGNLLELRTPAGARVIALSETAHRALNPDQLAALSAHATLITAAIPTIETLGGGSVRCTLAEVFLPHTP